MRKLACLVFGLVASVAAATDRPNVVMIIADDLGYGDVGCYGGRAIPTPELDRFAEQGIRFTRAYAPAATCTPTRYAIMTGEYPWRPKDRKTGVLNSDEPIAIEPGTPTLPSVLRDAGYRTALVGKWHLGIGAGAAPVDFNGHIAPGPREVGFDEVFYIPTTVDRVPCVFIENNRVAGLSTSDPLRIDYRRRVGGVAVGDPDAPPLKYRADKQHSRAIVNGISRIGYMAGGESAWWTDEDLTDVLLERAKRVIEAEGDRPYFLMLGLHDPHVPHAPHPRFVGKSKAGIRGDSIVQLDWLVGQVLDAIDAAGQGEETLVVFTSDNGPTVFDGYFDGSLAAGEGHPSAGELRGSKYLVYEGGCRVPTLVRWPGHVAPGVSDAFVTLTDMLPSLARVAGVAELPPGAGGDGIDVSAALLDAGATSPRTEAVLQGIQRTYALVTPRWKLVRENKDTFSRRLGSRPDDPSDARFLDGHIDEDALYDLAAHNAERHNLRERHPEIAKRMRERLDALLAE